MSDWLLRTSLRLVPRHWRESLRIDLEEEARTTGRSCSWCAWQVLLASLRLRTGLGSDAVLTDLRYALRSLGRSRGFALGAIVTFAVGIGVNVAVFSAVDRVLFRSLPFPASNELILLRECSTRTGHCAGSFPAAVAYEGGRRLNTVGDMAVAGLSGAYRRNPADADAPSFTLVSISPNLLRVIGVQPVLGRDVSDDEVRGRQSVALVSHEVWQARFGGDANLLGQTLSSDNASVPIVGVLPRGFVVPGWASSPAWHGVVVQYSGWSAPAPGPKARINPPIARLRPGSTLEQARAEIQALYASLTAVQPPRPTPAGPVVLRVDRLEGQLFSRFTEHAWLVVAAAGFVLLMACANVGSLLLARGRARQSDAALRVALGASRRRLLATSVIEALLVCAGGAVVSVLVLLWTGGALRPVLPLAFQQYSAGVLDVRVLGFALIMAALCAIVAGAWPGLLAARVDLQTSLQQSSERLRGERLAGGRVLIAVEACLGVMLVVGCLGALRSFVKLTDEDLGFEPANLYLVSVSVPRVSQAEAAAAYDQILDTMRQLPGVLAVGGADSVHTHEMTAMSSYSDGGRIEGAQFEVSDDYFRTLGSPLLAGREFSADEVAARAPVAIVNALAANQFWPGRTAEEVVGQRLSLPRQLPRTIVGVSKNLLEYYGETPSPALFVPLGTEPSRYDAALVRVAPDQIPDRRALVDRVRSLPYSSTGTVADASDGITRITPDPRFRAVLLTALAIAALALAAAGLYALASFDVARRRAEWGLRRALGATSKHLQWKSTSQVIMPMAVGSAVGVVLAYWTASFVQTFMYKVDARDPLTYVAAIAFIILTGAAAAWPAARRAAQADPALVLKSL